MSGRALAVLLLLTPCLPAQQELPLRAFDASRVNDTSARRLVILKVDGLNADLLYDTMAQQDPQTGKSQLPWLSHVFGESGTVFRNFYTRGISLSAPSWSILDTGRHSVIRGNVEYDRYTGRVYDYLNFFPFYLGYARNKAVDMPGVEVLDCAGIPLLIDRFTYREQYQSFQLFQRGVRWATLENALKRQFSGKALLGLIENGGLSSPTASFAAQTEVELESHLGRPEISYLDLFVGDLDHQGHATSDRAAMLHELHRLDSLVGRIWIRIQQTPEAAGTLLVVVSDHGMNNVPGVLSQTYNLPDLLNSPKGGAHHVITDREQLSDFKVRGINPLVNRVITPSTESFYLPDQESKYPTAWLDIDGNERAALYLRNSDLNKLHILLQQLARPTLSARLRKAAASEFHATVERHRAKWTTEAAELDQQLLALKLAIAGEEATLRELPKITGEDHETGADKAQRRIRIKVAEQQRDLAAYRSYVAHLRKLLAFSPEEARPFEGSIEDMIPVMALGDQNSVRDLQRYIVGPAPGGLVADSSGVLDLVRSFRYVNYPDLFARQIARNNGQPALSAKPIDFVALRLPKLQDSGQRVFAYWLYGDEERQLLVLENQAGELKLKPVSGLWQSEDGEVHWSESMWRSGLPLALFEDLNLRLPAGGEKAAWLSCWHNEREWMNAIHRCRYSNGVIGIVEELSEIGRSVPGSADVSANLVAFEKKRRDLVEADLHIFASDHWNFNARFPNPGGNHGSFLRISTHSVWMMAGGGVPARQVEAPYDSLSFASTLLHLVHREAPRPDLVVDLGNSK